MGEKQRRTRAIVLFNRLFFEYAILYDAGPRQVQFEDRGDQRLGRLSCSSVHEKR
jgi:hypothetical protein